MGRRKLIKAMGAGSAAAALAGCGALLPDDDEDSAETNGDVPDDPIEVGFQITLDGPGFVLTEQQVAAMEIAVDRINDSGGIAGREVEVETLNEGEGAIENHERFVDDEKDVIFGPATSGAVASVAPVADELGTLTIFPDGAAFTLFEDTHTDPELVFRFQNPDITETVVAARAVVEHLGGDNIDSIANVSPDYEFGHTQWEGFSTAVEALGGDVEVVYEGWPDLFADDMSSHVTEVASLEPDVLFTSMWGGDMSLFLRQGNEVGMWDEVGVHATTIGYGGAPDFTQEEVEAADPTVMVGRNYIYNYPPEPMAPAVHELHEELQNWGVSAVYGYTMSTYGAMTWYATAAERAVQLLGRWPEAEELAEIMSNHGFATPSVFCATDPDYFNGRQAFSNLHSGELTWDDENDHAGWTNVREWSPIGNHPPPGVQSMDWLEGW
ncbi:ABC transporter substrate-binding protein [Natronorarus salvus]|uniref:ABC transporter substrate-binding protein n=1 Tax=Natronorarus salvus TaxID=3117733 RepID=UPI002F266976